MLTCFLECTQNRVSIMVRIFAHNCESFFVFKNGLPKNSLQTCQKNKP